MSSTVNPKEEILDVLALFSIIPSFICKVSDTRGGLSIRVLRDRVLIPYGAGARYDSVFL